MNCSITGCERPFYARTWCTMHYVRWRTTGDPTKVLSPADNRVYTKTPWRERFWSKVEKTDGCWIWTGGKSRGYGSFKCDGKSPTKKAHRLAYEELVGPIPDGLHIDHLCRNRACVNPAHLEPVTLGENTRRGFVARQGDFCKRGHEFTPENTYRSKQSNTRSCRTCHRDRERTRAARVRALGNADAA